MQHLCHANWWQKDLSIAGNTEHAESACCAVGGANRTHVEVCGDS